MENYKILCNDAQISMIDRDVNRIVSLRDKLLSYSFYTVIGKCAIYFTSNSKKMIEQLKNYYTLVPINNFNGPIVFIRMLLGMDKASYENEKIYIIEKWEGIEKGKGNDKFYFKNQDNVFKIYKGFQYVEFISKSLDTYKSFLPIYIKIIEGIIIKNHLYIGYFPLHASLVGENNDTSLILADSQCGKTTTADFLLKNNGGEIYSDDIVFISPNENVLPFGTYRKLMNTDDVKEKFVESNNYLGKQCIRYIEKINPLKDVKYTIKTIYLPYICGYKEFSYEEVVEKKAKFDVIFNQLCHYPNEWFLFEENNILMAYEITKVLCMKKVISVIWPFNAQKL